MFNLPETAPWGAVVAVVVLVVIVSGVTTLARFLWPQESSHRKELWLNYLHERARRRRQIDERE